MGGKKKVVTAGERVMGLYTTAKKPLRYSVWGLTVIAVLAVVYLIFSLSYLDRVYPNVMVGSNNFDRLTLEQTKRKLADLAAAQPSQKLILQQGENTLEFVSTDVDWQVDVDATASAIYSYGRGDGSRWISFYHQLKAPFINTNLNPIVRYDENALAAKVSQVSDKANNPAVNASAELVSDKLVTTPEKAGEVVDEAQATADTLKLLNGLTGGVVTMTKRPDAPTTILGDVTQLQSQLDTLSTHQLTLKWDSGSQKLSKKDIRQLVGFIGGGPEGATTKVLTADFTTEQVQNFLTSISDKTDTPAVEPQLVITDGKLTIVKTSKEGRVVDLKASAATVLSTLAAQGDNPTATLTMKADTPVINESNLASLGIKERIGYGETNMRNSPANRRSNIANGISLLSSALIKPGEEFSTVTKLGAVDNTTGFLPELVIKDNRTVPEFGGGLCQVSTTLFRSVLNAGLKVTERQNHSYRVSYYEPPIGLDATIYLPKPDFKFLNDTPAYILIQAKVIGKRVIFELWGTNDGRTATVSDPVVSNLIDPPPPIYVDSDTLPLGETKITDHAHQGATAIAYYTVTRAGVVINKQTFKSIYKALPERGLHGTNASLPPTVPPPTP